MSDYTWNSLLVRVRQQLSNDDALRIIEEVSEYSRGDLLIHGHETVPEKVQLKTDEMVERRKHGEPLQYVLGSWGFRELDLYVDRRVLIPRPETETLVSVVLEELRESSNEILIADLGTGSGAIALSLAHEHKPARVIATDVSADALSVAGANLAGLGMAGGMVTFLEGEWFGALPHDLRGQFDVIVSNPPYIAEDEVLPAEVEAWEPTLALVAGASGLECYEILFAGLSDWLSPKGFGAFEMAPHQSGELQELGTANGFTTTVHQDLTGRDRILILRHSS